MNYTKKIMTVKQIHLNRNVKNFLLFLFTIALAPFFSKFSNLSKELINKVHDRCGSVGTVADCVRSKANKTGVRGLRVFFIHQRGRDILMQIFSRHGYYLSKDSFLE